MRSIIFKFCAATVLALFSLGAFACATYQYFESGAAGVNTEIFTIGVSYRTGFQSYYHKQGWKGHELSHVVVGTTGYGSKAKFISLPCVVPSHGYLKVMAANYKTVNHHHEWEITVEDKSQSHVLLWKGSYLCEKGAGGDACTDIS